MNDKAVFQNSDVPRTRFAGHSLIEILVVLIIVGVLIAIIVPAIQRARESARMAQCIHNQGQLAKAIHLHLADEPYGRFPGYRALGADSVAVIGWAPQVFEYLGRSDLPEDPTQATFVEVLVCPSNAGPTDSARLNYVVNGGQPDIDSAADGIFYDHAKPLADRVYITKDEFRDGLTNTIMIAENLDATAWNATDEADQCILWPLIDGNEVNNGAGARPSSHHPGGFVTAFADGSVKFMNETEINDDADVHTANSIYVALLTPGGDDSGVLDGGGGSVPLGPELSEECGGGNGELVGHWTFDDSSDWGRDSSGNGYHGTPGSSPAPLAMAGGGYALVFDGVDDKIDVPYVPELNTYCFTVSVWSRRDGSAATGYPSFGVIVCSRDAIDGGSWFQLFGHILENLGDNWGYVAAVATGSGVTGRGWDDLYGSTAPQGEWRHYAETVSSTSVVDGVHYGRMELYIDGVLVDSKDDIPYEPSNGRPLRFGSGATEAAFDPGAFWFKGAIDDVRMYNYALSASEIQQVMNEWAGP